MKLSRRDFRGLFSVAAFVIVVFILSLRAASLVNVPGEPDFSKWVLQDFRDSGYYSVVCYLSGGNPYDTETYRAKYPVLQRFSPYSPHFLLLHVPFGLLPHQLSQMVFFVFSIALTVLVACLSLTMCGRRPTLASVCGLAAMVLASRPGHQNLLVGQTTLEMVIGVYVALYYGRTSPWVSAVGVAAALQKVTFGLPLVLFMLWQKRVRPLVGGVVLAGSGMLFVLPRLASAAGGVVELAQSMWAVLHGAGANVTSQAVFSFARIDAVALVGRLQGSRPGLLLSVSIFVIVVGLACATLSRVGELSTGRAGDRYCIAVVCLATLVGTYHQSYSALLLVFPLTALVLNCWAPVQIRAGARVRLLLIGLLSIPFLNYLATKSVLTLLEPSRGEWLLLTSINGAALLLAFGVYVFLPFRRFETRDVEPVASQPARSR